MRAGAAHKMTAIYSALPPLRLAIKQKNKQGQTGYITEPNEVARIHSEPWAGEWKAYDPEFEKTFVPFFRKLRAESLEEASEFANSIDATAPKVRSALRNFSGSTATGCTCMHLRPMACLPDTALEKLGRLFKQSVASLKVPLQELLNILSLLGKNRAGAERSPSWRRSIGPW